MFNIPANIFAAVAPFVGDDNYHIDNMHIMVSSEKSYIEAVNGHAFCQHELDNLFSVEEKHILIAPTKELVKACKAKGAETLEISDDFSMRVVDTRGNTLYIHPANAKTCEAGQFPDTSPFIAKVNNPPENFSGVEQISLPCSSFELFKEAFGKGAIYKFTFTGETGPIKVSIQDTDFLVIVMPMLNR